MVSSGVTSLSTVSDTAISLLAADSNSDFHHLVIVNESGVAGAFSIDGGTTYAHWPDGAKSLTIDILIHSAAVKFKRVASGTDVTGLYAFMW